MSKQELKPRAKELYVVYQMSLADIGRELSIAPRTLQNWKSEGKWELERSRLTGSEQTFHAELFGLGELMVRKIKQDEMDGKEVSKERYAVLQRIIDTAETSRKYEAAAPKKTKDETSPEERQRKALAKFKEIVGLCKET